MKTTPAAEFLASPDPALRALPFSEAVRAGDYLFLAGQIGAAPGTAEPVPGGVKAEARQTMENIRAVLSRHGASLDDVVKCTVFLADMAEWPAFNEIYRGFFPNHFPSRSALGAGGLAKGARVEVECIAYRPSPR
jgi:2-iminobutanoate/2-iminopropanoate deaminase